MNTETQDEAVKIEQMPPAQLPAKMQEPQGATTGLGALNGSRPHYPASIAKAIIAVSKTIGAVAKDGENTFQKYKYQAWEDIVRALRPAMVDAGIMVTQSEVGRSIEEKLVTVTYEFSIYHESGEVWPQRLHWTGMCRLIDQKGVMDDKALNKCATQAHKYWAIHTFNIATPEAADSDADAPGKVIRKAETKAEPEDEISDEPHSIVAKGTGTKGWARLYQAALRKAPTAEMCDRWYLENRSNLVNLARADKPSFEACEAALGRRKAELKSGPANRPLPPRVDQRKEVVDPDTGEITDRLDDNGWLDDLEGALTGTEDAGELAKIKTGVLLSAQGLVSAEAWKLGVRLYNARVNAIMSGDIAE